MHPCRLECRIPAAHAPRCKGIVPRFTAFCDTLYEEILAARDRLRSESVLATIEQHRSGHRFPLHFFYPQAR
jgi:hypothetical protein